MDVGKTDISPPQKTMYSPHTKYSPLKHVLPFPISLLKFENTFLDYTQISVQICEKALRKKIIQGKVQFWVPAVFRSSCY